MYKLFILFIIILAVWFPSCDFNHILFFLCIINWFDPERLCLLNSWGVNPHIEYIPNFSLYYDLFFISFAIIKILMQYCYILKFINNNLFRTVFTSSLIFDKATSWLTVIDDRGSCNDTKYALVFMNVDETFRKIIINKLSIRKLKGLGGQRNFY